MQRKQIIIAIGLAIISTFFLSIGLIINSLMAYKGYNWAWTASLRFLLLLPPLSIIITVRKKLNPFWVVARQMPGTFLLWGCLGFGIFYGLLAFASTFAPGWLVIAAFMTTVLAGLLIAPYIYQDHRAVISKKTLLLSGFLVIGLLIMQLDKLTTLHQFWPVVLSITMALIAAFLWPLGSRKILIELEQRNLHLDPMQRVLGMTIGSLPVLLALAAYGYHVSGPPGRMQLISAFVAVVFSGLIGFVLYYKSLQMVKLHPIALATVEATQVCMVFFTLFGEMIFKGTHWPGIYGDVGFLIMLLGLSCYCFLSLKQDDTKYRADFKSDTTPVGGLKKSSYIISVTANDKPGLVSQITSVFNKNLFVIDSVSASRTDIYEVVSVLVEAVVDDQKIDNIVKKINNIIEVSEVKLQLKAEAIY